MSRGENYDVYFVFVRPYDEAIGSDPIHAFSIFVDERDFFFG
jgi:hypothetical protein